MSSGLTVNKALYGTGTTTVDVTGAVSKKVKDGVLNFTVSPSSFGIDDPAPGQLKKLDLSYTINNGKKNEMMKNDNDLVWIDAPPKRDASGLQIVRAEYGYTGNFTDVTTALQNLMKSDGSIDIKVGYKELGLPDPNPNKQKTLSVEYTINGASTVNNIIDGERFRVSAPAMEGDTSGQPKLTDNLNSILFMVIGGAFTFIGMFIYFASAFITANFAKQVFGDSSMIWYLFFVIGMIPFIGFWGLPPLVFFIRLFKTGDLITA